MHGLPKDFDATIFVGHELVQICFTVNTISLFFDGEISVNLLASFAYRPALSDARITETVPATSSSLMQLIGQEVASASAQADGTLTIIFQSGASLFCLDDSPDYESYSIRIGEIEIIV